MLRVVKMGAIIFLINIFFGILFFGLAFSAFVLSINAVYKRFIALFVCGAAFAILCGYCAHNAIIGVLKCF